MHFQFMRTVLIHPPIHLFKLFVAGDPGKQCPSDSILTPEGECKCALEDCPTCERGLIKTVLRKGLKLPGDCCDHFTCAPSPGEYFYFTHLFICNYTWFGKAFRKATNSSHRQFKIWDFIVTLIIDKQFSWPHLDHVPSTCHLCPIFVFLFCSPLDLVSFSSSFHFVSSLSFLSSVPNFDYLPKINKNFIMLHANFLYSHIKS